jgi:Mitochondrial carrier protein
MMHPWWYDPITVQYPVSVYGFREEGVLAFWKGNGANVIRIFPYSAAQLAANDTYKRLLEPEGGRYTAAPAAISAISESISGRHPKLASTASTKHSPLESACVLCTDR